MSAVTVKWVGSKLMVGADSRWVPLVVSSWAEREPRWTGLKASDLLLISAASCSMYDVVVILQKQRADLQQIEVSCEGEQQADPPHRFTKIHLHYIAKGKIDPRKLDRAIDLSQNKYCSVIATLRAGVEISYDFEIIE